MGDTRGTDKKILLMYISEHSGHHQAAMALENALLKKAPASHVLNINAFSYVNPVMEKIIHKAYMKVIKKRPEIWGYLYDNPKVVKNTGWLRNFLNDRNSRKMDTLIKRFEPDIVACTQAFPCGIFASYKKRHQKNTPLVGILTDYAPHSYWIYDDVNAYIAPSGEVGDSLVKKGVAKSRIKILGVPIDPSFSAPMDKNGIRKRLGVSHEIPVVLVMGGTHGIGPGKKLIQALADSKEQFSVIVITGINKDLLKNTKEIAARSRKKIIAMGFVSNVHEIMGASDVIITKPGGLTTAEAVAKALPIIILNPLPGQEGFNTKAFTQKGMAVKAKNEADAVKILEELLDDTARLEKMRKTMAENAKPDSASKIADFLLSLAG